MSRVDRPRRAAYDLLRAVADDGAYANLTLPRLLRERGISGRDAAFATELGYGTLRAQGTLDAVIAASSSRKLSTVDKQVLDVLRLGTYQLLRTRVPVHAAVSTSVDLAPKRASGFVNAVLRKVSRSDLEVWLDTVTPSFADDPVKHLALRHAHPQWIVEAIRDALGGDLEETRAALAGDDQRPVVHLATADRDHVLTETGGTAGPWSPYAIHLTGGDPGRLPAVVDGRARVQDEGSQLVALAFASAPLEGTDESWVDLCAGPGGKAALAGGLARDRGARLLAIEPREHRAELTRQACAGLPVTVVQGDGRDPDCPAGSADRVLVDAPCSGLGALRRRPESRWRRQPEDIPRLVTLQHELLASALRTVRPGGIVVYSTCSPHLAETAGIVGSAEGAQVLDARPLLPGVPALGDGPTVQLWPHRHGTDAMFLAVLRRSSPADEGRL